MEVFIAKQEDDGLRLDQWLASATDASLSRSRIKAIIEDGGVKLNGKPVREPKRKIASGDSAEFAVPKPVDAAPKAQKIPLDILYEDDDLIVINKPPGLIVHPGAGNPDGTLVNALIYHCGDSLSGVGGVKRPGIVHRLDKDTSGVMVVAKHDQAHKHLSAQFADHGRTGALRRTYRALVWGAPNQPQFTISNYLGRSSADRTKQAIVSETQPDARHAITHIEIIGRYGPKDGSNWIASLVDCSLETGRTHQIRVHMASEGFPLIGDHVYGAGFKTKTNTLPPEIQAPVHKFDRQALHARLLAFEHPKTGQIMDFQAPEPEDMGQIIALFSDGWPN